MHASVVILKIFRDEMGKDILEVSPCDVHNPTKANDDWRQN